MSSDLRQRKAASTAVTGNAKPAVEKKPAADKDASLYARESVQFSTSISDGILALSAFTAAKYLWTKRARCDGDPSVYFAGIVGLLLMGWPAFLGVFRFLFVNIMPLRRVHRFFAAFGGCVGVPLLGVSMLAATTVPQPAIAAQAIRVLAAVLVIGFALVRLRILKVEDKTYLVLISLCGLICMLIRGARELSRGLYLCATSPWTMPPNLPKSKEFEILTNRFHCIFDSGAGVLCLIAPLLIIIGGLAVGTEGYFIFEFGKRKIYLPKVDVYHYMLAVANLCATSGIMALTFADLNNMNGFKNFTLGVGAMMHL